MEFRADAFRVLPFLHDANFAGRILNLLPYWDGREWHSWFPVDGALAPVGMTGLIEGEYLGREPEAATDLNIRFIEFIWQRASWPDACSLWQHLTADVRNFATSVAKLELFHAVRDSAGHGVSAFVQTELEYLLIVARSIFDLLQEFISRVWAKRVMLYGPGHGQSRPRKQLPATFSKIVLRNKERLRSTDDIVKEFGVGPSLATAYANASSLFTTLRKARDAIVHSGKSIEMIFPTEKGFCALRDSPIFKDLYAWSVQDSYNENLVVLLPAIRSIVWGTLAECDNIIDGFCADVQFPGELAPMCRVYLRGCHNGSLLRLSTEATPNVPSVIHG